MKTSLWAVIRETGVILIIFDNKDEALEYARGREQFIKEVVSVEFKKEPLRECFVSRVTDGRFSRDSNSLLKHFEDKLCRVTVEEIIE